MQSVFLTILKTSIMASCMVLCILLLKKIFNKYMSAGFHYYLWLLVILRLTMPFSLESPLSIFNIFSIVQNYEGNKETTLTDNKEIAYEITATRQLGTGKDTLLMTDTHVKTIPLIENSYYIRESFIQHLAIIWLLGLVIISTLLAGSVLIFRIRLSKSQKCKEPAILDLLNNLREKLGIKKEIPIILYKNISTPTIFSFLSPKLIIPYDMINYFTLKEMEHIFRHELQHYRRKDLLVFWLVSLLQAIYWFNPLLWYAFLKMERDCESSCDIEVLKQLQDHQYSQYGMTLVKAASLVPIHNIASINLGAGKSFYDIKRRVMMISNFKNRGMKKRHTVLAAVIVSVVGIAFLTNPLANSVKAQTVNPDESAEVLKTSTAALKANQADVIFYDEKSARIVVPKTDRIKSAEDIKQTDKYWDKIYQFSVEGESNSKIYSMESPLIKSIHTESRNSTTTLTIYEKEIIGFVCSEDEGNIYFTAKKPVEAYEHVVVIDPAHGGNDRGGIYKDVFEKDLNLALAKKIEAIASNTKESHIKVYLTRQNDTKIALADATTYANAIGGAYINLHYNQAAPNRIEARGTEAYYFEKNIEAKRLAEILNLNLVKDLKIPGNGVKTGEFHMIKNVNSPAAAIEVGYLTHKDDLGIILSEGFTEKAALAILNGLREYVGIEGEFQEIANY